MMQCSLMLMLFLVQSVAASAETKLYMEDFSIVNGETMEVALVLDNEEEATALQAKIDLPNGLQYVDGSIAKTDRVKGRAAEVKASTSTGKLVIVETDGTIEAGEGAVITFRVRRNYASQGNYKMYLSDIVVSDANAEQLNTEETQTVNVSYVGLKDCTFAGPEAIDVAVGQEYQVDVTLKNEGVNNLSAFQGILTLPEGLEIVEGDEGKFIYTDRIPGKAEFKFQEFDGNKLSFVLSSSTNLRITGTDGVIFSFKVKATEAFAENAEIKLTDLRVAATTGESAPSPDVTISVTNTSVADKAAFEAYQTEQAAAVVAMAVEGDSEASQKLIADAKAAIEGMAFDYAKTLDEQKAAIDEVVTTVAATLEAQREAEATEAAAVEAANAKLAGLKTAAEALVISDEAKASEDEAVKAAVADAETAIAAVAPAISAVEAIIAEGKLATDNKEALETAFAAVEGAIETADDAIKTAENTYKNQKQIDDAAEAGAKASAEASLLSLQIAMEDAVVSDEAKAYEAENVQAAVADAETAIATANDAIAAVEAIIAEGKLATDNKVAIAQAINAAQKAVNAAVAKAEDAEQTYIEQKEEDEKVIPGDVNGDGEVNVGDLVCVSNFMAGEAGDITKEAADVNKDGEVNVGDMVTITNIMAGNE